MIKIYNKSKCSGCYSCANICPKNCIKMTKDDEGFWYPKVDEIKCVNCGICEEVCPIIHAASVKNNPIAYAVFNKNEKIRLRSSSGGVFTILAEYVIKHDGVVFGACFNEKFDVIHSYTDHIEELSKLRGSKYTQSKIGNTYSKVKEFLDANRLVLFTGTPCQIGGLKSYLGNDYINLYCQDIICHGVPSPQVWQKYVTYREKIANSKTQRMYFRHKNEGWKGYSVLFLFSNGAEYHQTHKKDMMMSAFLQNICLRPSCYECSFKTLDRQSDITLGDFWGIQNIMPEMDDDKGTSLVIINSDKGKELFDAIKEITEFKLTNLNEAIKCNPSMIFSVASNRKREKFFKDFDCLDFDKLIKKYCTDNYIVVCKRKILECLSKIKHMIFKRHH